MSKPVLNVGLIGYQFMGKAHSNAYRQVGRFFDLPFEVRLHTICGRNESGVKAAAEKFGWDNYETDWKKVVANPEIDIIDISTPGDSHAEISIAASKAGKIVFCEKPIGNTLEEAQAMYDAAKESGRPTAVFHAYRKAPAVALAKRMIDEGKLGTIYHVRATYLQDWIADPEFPLVWRFQKEKAGSGAHGDLGAHIIDLARHLVGEFTEVCGMLHTFIMKRPILAEADDRLGGKAGSEMGDVTVDDASVFLAKFDNGAIGTFEATRMAVGRKNYNRIEINGSKGSIVFNVEKMNELEYFDNTESEETHGFRVIQVTEGSHPYTGSYWPVGHIVGYEHTFINLLADAITAIHENKPIDPDYEDGLKNQIVLDAVERSSETRVWVKIGG